MGRVLAVWVPDWPVLTTGTDMSVPLAVVAGGSVVACSAAARATGVRRRMRLRAAQARCADLHVVDRDLAEEVRRFEPVVRHLEQSVMPRLEVIRPGLIAAPTRGPSRYWGGEPQLVERTVQAITELGHPARAGIADTVFAAALAARTGHLVPAGGSADFLAPYPVAVLGRPRLAELLGRLGITTVGQFAALPAARVLARFGTEGAAAHRIASGIEQHPVTSRPSGPEQHGEQVFEPPTVLLEPVVFAAKAAADQLHERLTAAALVCARLEVRLELADGRHLARAFRHEGRLSALAVAERVRGLLQAWADAGAIDRGGEPGGIVRLVLTPEQLSAATGRQAALFGETLTPEEVERAAARVQALLGHRAVIRIDVGGGRGPVDRLRRVPYGDLDTRRLTDTGPWPGQLPAPHPATTFTPWLPASLTASSGAQVGVSARTELSDQPARLAVQGYPEAAIEGWAGPWPVLEAWWNPERAQRMARMQIVTADGHAWLLVIEHSRWWAEASYG
ncbi:DNA polymerase Y family protein [Streptomyces sp. NPDC050485]|uniref:DNA polymerase Y family protein n=1 Tax=Streptomyces sp. NPDC050485 TaxID=3365617 RepID=UPI0037B5B14C